MKFKSYTVWGIIFLGVGVISGCSGWSSSPESLQTERNGTAAWEVYQNDRQGFRLSYPTDLDIHEYSDENVVIGEQMPEGIEGLVEVRMLMVEGTAGRSFEEVAGAALVPLCAADGPDESINCTTVVDRQPFNTTSGLAGFELYLLGEQTTLSTGEVEELRKGPFYLFALGTGATASRAVVVHPPFNINVEDSDTDLIMNIAKSLEVFEPTNSEAETVEAYVVEHISELSPEKEVLGGTFYVTNIVVENGAGTVEYEDGHIALVADFRYEVGENEEVVIREFEIRE